ncbi:hypothetical protein ALO94_200991 [Pseudomonas syringae pv. spinaceae]|uniref:GIY-YIG nuclease n=1 Tax=Pseudomonas syringae pv. spinaceae TaxID=264459 RepID=A0A0Q0CGK7_PSESX|nr:hypothetical protein ALO94_200991 [Pseudomonas syringae pv. spinaceae]
MGNHRFPTFQGFWRGVFRIVEKGCVCGFGGVGSVGCICVRGSCDLFNRSGRGSRFSRCSLGRRICAGLRLDLIIHIGIGSCPATALEQKSQDRRRGLLGSCRRALRVAGRLTELHAGLPTATRRCRQGFGKRRLNSQSQFARGGLVHDNEGRTGYTHGELPSESERWQLCG